MPIGDIGLDPLRSDIEAGMSRTVGGLCRTEVDLDEMIDEDDSC